ncbi:hypothetical protein KP509_38G061900 [Ceratopteris richardii]|uniref:Uncharacterized protein n=1 Tax=Ceratopteris richardii TaxID=49495 RepID=A0A8T2Q6E4_CERRI|nr:hypothetical protein KP509_38G061900 [Ceratopteris richardii]
MRNCSFWITEVEKVEIMVNAVWLLYGWNEKIMEAAEFTDGLTQHMAQLVLLP